YILVVIFLSSSCHVPIIFLSCSYHLLVMFLSSSCHVLVVLPSMDKKKTGRRQERVSFFEGCGKPRHFVYRMLISLAESGSLRRKHYLCARK
ncbi:hypothetical protein ACMYZ5_05805, partial [Bacteroides sp. KG68]|uniref:hypothetical protein n=1 Tax=unclassified Bacteroides TaxID=2646097 RepID=UPI003D965540